MSVCPEPRGHGPREGECSALGHTGEAGLVGCWASWGQEAELPLPVPSEGTGVLGAPVRLRGLQSDNLAGA